MRGKIVLLAVVTAFVSTLFVGTSLYLQTARIALDKDVKKLEAQTDLLLPRFRANFDQMRNDILSVSRMPPIDGLVYATANGGIDPRDGSTLAQWYRRLERIFVSTVEFRPDYLQMRLVSLKDSGRELVRVDLRKGRPEAVPPAYLQDKAAEPYFDLARRIAPGQVGFSAVTYNRDDGKVDFDLPVIRAVTPIFDLAGEPYAFLVINA